MPKVGNTLKQARACARLTVEQLAGRTKIQLHNLEALESDRFDLLPTGIYLDGIIRAYAQEVAVDADPLVELARRERQDAAAMWEAPVMFDPVQSENAPHHFDDVDVPHAEDIDARVDASGQDDWTRPRNMELALPTLAVFAAASVMALFYQATHPYEPDAPAPVAYAPWMESPVEQPSRAPVAVAAAPQRRPVESATVAADEKRPTVTGAWAVATHVESSSYTPYNGMQLGYEVELEQDGDRVSGMGRKILENGDGIAARAQTPIAVNGTVDGDRVLLDFVERGARRETQGSFVLTRAADGGLSGKFRTSAARSAGSVMARRVR